MLTSIDYSKAFNRLEHGAVLQSFKRAGASQQILNLLASFLIGRTMRVRAGQAWSAARPVNAGAPQGWVLGTYIFNVGTDTLEEDFEQTVEESEYELEENDLAFLETQSQTSREVSTPLRSRRPNETPATPAGLTPIRGEQQHIEFLPRVVNPPISRRIEPSWRHKQIQFRKYVNDNLQAEKLKMKTGVIYDADGRCFKNVRAEQLERLFRHISGRASDRGFKSIATRQHCLLYLAPGPTRPDLIYMTMIIAGLTLQTD